ncbi:MAG: Holliday junction branch migration protein RuvA [Candidatus Paceibacterota bacterium]
MIHTIEGVVKLKGENFVVVETGSAGGLGFKVFTNKNILFSIKKGKKISFFTYLYLRENEMELYGFKDEKTLRLFEMLKSVSGIGPKTALGVLDTDKTERIIAAIVEKRADFLTKTPGIGKKTADRVILELKSKLSLPKAGEITEVMDVDSDLEDTLASLGYPKKHIKRALSKLGDKPVELEERLKEALKLLSK